MGREIYHGYADGHKPDDVILALFDADFRSPDIPESRPVHRDGLSDQFGGVEPRLGERSGLQVPQVLLDPSIHLGVTRLLVIGKYAPDAKADGNYAQELGSEERQANDNHPNCPSGELFEVFLDLRSFILRHELSPFLYANFIVS